MGDYTFDELMAGGYGPIVAYTNGTLTVTTDVPEPSLAAALLGLSGLGLAFLPRRRQENSPHDSAASSQLRSSASRSFFCTDPNRQRMTCRSAS